MNHSFRPVKEIWNMHSSCFVEPEELTSLLHDLAARVGTASDEHEYGDNKAVWLEDGTKVGLHRNRRALQCRQFQRQHGSPGPSSRPRSLQRRKQAKDYAPSVESEHLWEAPVQQIHFLGFRKTSDCGPRLGLHASTAEHPNKTAGLR